MKGKTKMSIFTHHIYEYKRGLRNLILHTIQQSNQPLIEQRLTDEHIAYIIGKVNRTKINVFFGHCHCIKVLASFETLSLDKLSNEQDFILGIMLGYDRLKQCKRYILRKENTSEIKQLIG